jgi:hypothetical protein
MPIRSHAVLVLLLAVPTLAQALPPPVGFSLEAAVSAAPGGAAARFVAVSSCWIDGDLEAEARFGFGSADRPGGRGADALTPALGLRWGPDVGRWRPLLGVEAGARIPVAGPGVAPTAAARAGVELFARRELSVSLAVGWRWTSGAASGSEAIFGVGYYP